METNSQILLKPSSFFALFKNSVATYKKYFWFSLKIFLIPALLTFIMTFFEPSSFNSSEAIPLGADASGAFTGYLVSGLFIFISIIFLIVIFLQLWPQVAYLKSLKMIFETGKTPSFLESFIGSFNLVGPFFWIKILEFFVILGGILFLIIPGIIFSIWFTFSSYILVFEGIRGLEALLRSKQLVQGYWWHVYLSIIFFVLILAVPVIIITFFFGQALEANSILNAMSQAFLILIYEPLILIFVIYLYQDQLKLKNLEPQKREKKSWLYVFIILGVISLVLIPVIIFGLFKILEALVGS